MKLIGGLLAPLARLPVKFLRVEKSVDCNPKPKLIERLGSIVLEYQIGKFHGTSIGRERALPVLGHIKTVKRSFGSDILESDIGHIARASGVCLDESDIIALYDGNVASMLLDVSVRLW